jgi:RHS repeat-associated protein
MENSEELPERRPVQGRRAVGHPVDVASGVFFLAWHDVEIGGQAPLVFRRYFSTTLTRDAAAGLGPGWTHNFALVLAESTDGYLLRDQNGSIIQFPVHTHWPAVPIINAASSMELRREGEWFCVYHWHDWRTAVEKLWFRRSSDGGFLLERISSPAGFGLVLSYDPGGRLIAIMQMVEGRRISLIYDNRGFVAELRLASWGTPERTVATYGYDQRGRLVAVRDAVGASMGYAYDPEGRMVAEYARSGAVFTMRYDSQGRCVETRGTDGHHATHLQYAPSGITTLVTDSLGNVTVFELNADGQVLRETRPDGGVLAIRYDALGRIVEEVDALGGATQYRYDERSNTASVVYSKGLTMEMQYDGDHQPLIVRQGESTWRFTYARGQLVAVVDPWGTERRYGYDARGFLSMVIEPTGNVVRIEPDEGWSRIRFFDDYGFEREEHYNDLMHITRRVEPDGGIYRFDFDEMGRLVQASLPGLPLKRYTYDAGGQLASATDEDGYTTHLSHNNHGLLERVVTPQGRVHTCSWDTEGRLKTWTNPAGEKAEFGYDAAGNQTEVRHFDGRAESRVFDVAGRVTRRQLPDGTTLSFEYDGASNLLRLSSGVVDLITSEYDVLGRLLRTQTPGTDVVFEYDGGVRIVAEVQNGRRVEHTYGSIGQPVGRRLVGSPLPPLEFEWDRRLRLVAARRDGTLVQRLAYDTKDQCVERHFGNCVERLEYGVAGTLVAQTVMRQTSVLVSRSWEYDGRRNVIRIHDRHSGHTRYQFDGDHRLVQSQFDGAVTNYSYNASGSLTGWTGATSRTLEYVPGDQLVRSGTRDYERDANGRVTRVIDERGATSLIWNALSQLMEVQHPDGSVVRYTYDGLGRRLSRETDGIVTEYVWAGEQVLAEITAGEITEFLFGDFNPNTLWRGAEVFHLVNSHLGVPLEAVTESGTVVWRQRLAVWGALERVEGTAQGPVSLRFPGQFADDGFYYNRYRYYDPEACQYLSPDPLGLAAGANEYMYGPNPVNWIDPFGLSCGIPPGTHSVYVLESGKRPPPNPGTPPLPPVVIYVGITVQSPHDRLSQHKSNPPGGVTPDGMRIIASGPPTVPDRASARLIESSILTNHPHQPPPGGGPKPPGSLNNAGRPVNGGYYHSNVPSSAPPGTTHLPPSTTNPMLAPTHGSVIT